MFSRDGCLRPSRYADARSPDAGIVSKAELGTVFLDEYIALGGDEVSFGCATAVKKEWLREHNLTADELLPYFWKRVTAEVLPHLNKTLSVWGTDQLGNLDPSIVPPGTVFNLYTQLDATLNTTAHRGVPGVLSAPYYLDQTQSYRMGPGGGLETHQTHQTPNQPTNQPRSTPTPYRLDSACGMPIHHINEVWKCFYASSPDDGVDDPALAANTSLVMGGEACIWGEGTTKWSIESQSLTGASAVAERLWTGVASPTAESRLGDHVCLMNMLGLRATAIGQGFCPADLV